MAGRIIDDDVALVRETARIDDVVREHVALKSAGGGSLKGLCPFHDEKSPSFHVTPSKGYWYCLAGETGVLTLDGVIPIRELAGKTAKVLRSDATWVDAPFYSFGVQPLMKLTLSRNGKVKEVFATAEHRWFVRAGKGQYRRKERITSELKPGDRLFGAFPRPRLLPGRGKSRPSPNGVARGFVFGDGYRQARGSVAQFCGAKDEALVPYFEGCTFIEAGPGVKKAFNLPAYFKDEFPPLDEAPGYLYGWLAGYFAADGCVSEDGSATLHSASKKNLEFVRDLCTRLGIGTYGIGSQMRVGYGTEHQEMFVVRFMTEDLPEDFFLIPAHRDRYLTVSVKKSYERRGWVVKSVEPTDRVEEVFCAVVPGTHDFTLEDNILTGNCFGCSEGGDVIGFVQKADHLSFAEAVEKLAAKYNISLRYEQGSSVPGKQSGVKTRLLEAHKAAAEFYAAQLATPAAEVGRAFLTGRGFDREAAAHFGVGFAPPGWDALTTHLRGRGFTDAELIQGGLAVEGRRGAYDRFRGRLVWPIRDGAGDVVGFGARKLLDDDDGPKYLNTPETPIYKKSQVLYGLDLARRDIAKNRQAVVVEGYTDVMACHLAGVTTAVATCGTAFGDEHARVLRRLLLDGDVLSGEVVFTFDSDAAGRKAAIRAFEQDQQFVTRTFVAIAPDGLDPCDLRMQQGDDAVRAMVSNRTPLFEFAIKAELADHDLNTAEGRVAALRAAAPLISRIKDDALRPEYVRLLAGWVGVDEARVREVMRATVRPSGRTAPPPPVRPAARRGAPDPVVQVERDSLKILLQEPDLVGDWFDPIEPQAFTHPTARAVFEAIAATGGPTPGTSGQAWVESVLDNASDDSVRSTVLGLAVEPLATDTPDTRYAQALIARLLELDAERRVDEIKGRLQRTEPTAPEHQALFAELLALEEERRSLHAMAVGE